MTKLAYAVAGIAAAATLSACGGSEPADAATGTKKPPVEEKRGTVVFEVGGDYTHASYDDNFENGIEYPEGTGRVELTGDDVPQPPKPLYTWANSAEGRDTEAWCRITVDGKVVMEDRQIGEANDPMCLYMPTP
ncbi:membrane protein [Mycobacterium phage MA5]|uniref:Membrane protein n=1 Tax=Mycobacterium phage MA5 TaxID=2725640 RepID=A0A6M3T1C1_9CAUD|nr:membrane protein [Mycobacterium phage MA5]QJD52085.1 membrane protein [Mycobacterium phage MA5]